MYSVQGHLLDLTVIGCSNLKDTEWISRQDPYVILEYAGNKYRTKTDTDGGRHPSFNEKFTLQLIEGLREMNVYVWNSNSLTSDDFIGSGKLLLQKVLNEGFHDSTWPLTTQSGRRAGEIRVILHYTSPKEAHKVTSVQQGATPNAIYPPSYGAGAVYPPPQLSQCACYPPPHASYPPPQQTPNHSYCGGGYTASDAYGARPPYPYHTPLYPPPMYPPQGYSGHGAPPAGYYPPQGYSGHGAPPAGYYPPPY